MKKKFNIIVLVGTIFTMDVHSAARGNEMQINVDIGKNIEKTAQQSGVRKFGIENHWGLQIYELVNLRPEVTVKFARAGFEITANPLFALTMYADSENNNDMAVVNIELQYNYKARSHHEAKVFVESILMQFRRGKWRRYISETCPAVTGRSAYLDEAGNIESFCPLDPNYSPSTDDWMKLMEMGKYYDWLGDGVLARLTVDFDEDTRGLTYNINLEFKHFVINQRRLEAQHAIKLIEGDKKGWRSTENHKKAMVRSQEKLKILEENAIRRGDHLVVRD